MGNIWDIVLSVLVGVHLLSEYGHYFWEWYSGRKEQNILEDIQNHRKQSTKTEKLIKIQRDLDLIKKRLNINEN